MVGYRYYDYANVNIRYFQKSKEKIHYILQLILLKTPIILHVEFTAYIESAAKNLFSLYLGKIHIGQQFKIILETFTSFFLYSLQVVCLSILLSNGNL